MTEDTPTERWIVNVDSLPERFPTHRHPSSFWESLGRTVATFGFLEESLAKAIFSFTATRPFDETEVHAEFEKWLPQLERALTDTLGGLIDRFGKAVRDHPNSTIEDIECLLDDLRKVSEIRNVLCHGSWNKVPDANGASKPFCVNRGMMIFDALIDRQFFDQTQRHVTELSCSVMNTVTHMGWTFPGSGGPGKPIFGS